MAKNFEDKLPRLWEAIANKLMDKHTFVNRLEELLREHGVTEKKNDSRCSRRIRLSIN